MKKSKSRIILDRVAVVMFVSSVLLGFFSYGVAVGKYKLFPHSILRDMLLAIESVRESFEYNVNDLVTTTLPHDIESASPGLNLVVSVTDVVILDMLGEEIHRWNIDWFSIWPEATHLTKRELPKSRPGTHIHGAVVLQDGDLVFNFEHLGLVRLDPCGNTVWKLPYRTHHSVHLAENGNLWVSGQINRDVPLTKYPYLQTGFIEPTVLEISPSGEILRDISILDVLHLNDLNGLLYLASLDNLEPRVSGDTLHLNDVEVFPESLPEGLFKTGDIMVSLRNINTVFVFDPVDLEIKYIIIGRFVRQHDPDFIDGDTISVFDNNNRGKEEGIHFSRILIFNANESRPVTHYTGDQDTSFYTAIMGKHQWLDNGNMLVSESQPGKAFEVKPDGEIVWELNATTGSGEPRLTEEVQRIPQSIGRNIEERVATICE